MDKVDRADRVDEEDKIQHYNDVRFERLGESVGFLVNCVARLMRNELDFRLKPLGLTGTTWSVLVALYEEDRLSQTDLSLRTMIDAATMTRSIDSLEARRYIDRNRDDDDRRVQIISLTEEGMAAAFKAAKVGEVINREAMVMLLDTETRQMYSIMHRMMAQLYNMMDSRMNYLYDMADGDG